MAKTSIIIPCYNQARYIGETLDSVRRQTRPPLETMVIDDGSTDNLEEALAPHRGLIIYQHQANRGPAAARNAGVHRSHGEYVLFLDADDMIAPNHLERLESSLDAAPLYDVCYSDFRSFRDDDPTTLIEPKLARYSGNIFRPLLSGSSFIPLHTALVRKRAVLAAGLFDEALKSCEDPDLWIRLALLGSLFLYVPEPLALYRLLKGSRSHDRIVMWSEFLRVLDKADSFVARRDGRRDPYIENRKRFFLELLIGELRSVYRIKPPLRCRLLCRGMLRPLFLVSNLIRRIGAGARTKANGPDGETGDQG